MKEYTFEDWLNNNISYFENSVYNDFPYQAKLLELVAVGLLSEEEYSKIYQFQRDCFNKLIDTHVNSKLKEIEIIKKRSPNFDEYKKLKISEIDAFLLEHNEIYKAYQSGTIFTFNAKQSKEILDAWERKSFIGIGKDAALFVNVVSDSIIKEKLLKEKVDIKPPKYHIENLLAKRDVDYIKKMAEELLGPLTEKWTPKNKMNLEYYVSFLKVIIDKNYFRKKFDPETKDAIISDTFGESCTQFKWNNHSYPDIERIFSSNIKTKKATKNTKK